MAKSASPNETRKTRRVSTAKGRKAANEVVLSVIIPAHNPPGDWLRRILDALAKQMAEYPSVEIIVVDDASDVDVTWVKDYPKVRYKRVENRRDSMTRNAGLDMARGEYIQFLDCDDIIYDNCLSVIFDNINAGYDWVSYNWECDGHKEWAHQNKGILMVNCAVWAYTFKRTVIGGIRFDESLKTGSDQVWLRKVLTDDVKHRHDERIFYNYRWAGNENSICHRKLRGEL